jgi:hypothetical protein
MTEKLEYLDKLKNNMGEEMAEMMSEEITKVMDEQREMEQTYARLITERGELKGISNKHKLHETKNQILVSVTCIFRPSRKTSKSRPANCVGSCKKTQTSKATSARSRITRKTLSSGTTSSCTSWQN